MTDRFQTLCHMTEELSGFTLQWFKRLQDVEQETKGDADYVSKVDREAEAMARSIIKERFPEDRIVGEEEGGEACQDYWVIDPVDGTVNFLSGLAYWGVSLAYVEDGKPRYGAIALPALGMFLSGGGEHDLHVRGPFPQLVDPSPKAFGIGRNPIWAHQARQKLETELEQKGYHIVSLGSCSASLAMVATGRLAGYIENDIKIWDCAAGHILCNAAGASSRIENGAADHSAHISAGWDAPLPTG